MAKLIATVMVPVKVEITEPTLCESVPYVSEIMAFTADKVQKQLIITHHDDLNNVAAFQNDDLLLVGTLGKYNIWQKRILTSQS